MKNPFGPDPDAFPSHIILKQRILKNVQAANVNDQIFQLVQNAFENALNKENIVLSRPERVRLFSQTLRSVLEDMITKLDDRSKTK
jgi:hypothetical protein